METRPPQKCTIALTVAFVYLTIGSSSALSCYSCGWNPENCKTKRQLNPEEDVPQYPVPEKCVGNKTHPPDKTVLAKDCVQRKCEEKDPACMIWTFISGSPENRTFMCVGNPGRRSGCFEKEIPSKEKEKYNTKTLKVQVCLCDYKDYCNGADQTARVAILLLLLVVILSLRSNSGFSCG